jgi:hypothetical protein
MAVAEQVLTDAFKLLGSPPGFARHRGSSKRPQGTMQKPKGRPAEWIHLEGRRGLAQAKPQAMVSPAIPVTVRMSARLNHGGEPTGRSRVNTNV